MSQVRAVLRGGVWDGEDLAAGPRPSPLPLPAPRSRAGAEEEEGFGPWSPWSPCSKTCTHPERPATKTRERPCVGTAVCSGDGFQEQPCNLPLCSGRSAPPSPPNPRPPHGLRAPWHGRQALPTPRPRVPADVPPCQGEDCAGLNCSWAPWGPWAECSRSCGVGRQQRLRAYSPPGAGGRWCPGILSAFVQRRFCSLQACKGGGRTGGGRHPEGLCSAPGGPWRWAWRPRSCRPSP